MKEIIRKFVQSIDKRIEISFNTDDFCVDIDEECIYIPLAPNVYDTEIYMNFLAEQLHVTNIDSFIISILHEIGHIMTYSYELEKQRDLLYSILLLQFDKVNIKEYNYKYFSIPMELIATNWAIDYYNTHKEYCTEISAKLGIDKQN